MKKTVSVAPMMDCTDKHEIYFLSLISKNIHLYSEMIVANAIIRGDREINYYLSKKFLIPLLYKLEVQILINLQRLVKFQKITDIKKLI